MKYKKNKERVVEHLFGGIAKSVGSWANNATKTVTKTFTNVGNAISGSPPKQSSPQPKPPPPPVTCDNWNTHYRSPANCNSNKATCCKIRRTCKDGLIEKANYGDSPATTNTTCTAHCPTSKKISWSKDGKTVSCLDLKTCGANTTTINRTDVWKKVKDNKEYKSLKNKVKGDGYLFMDNVCKCTDNVKYVKDENGTSCSDRCNYTNQFLSSCTSDPNAVTATLPACPANATVNNKTKRGLYCKNKITSCPQPDNQELITNRTGENKVEVEVKGEKKTVDPIFLDNICKERCPNYITHYYDSADKSCKQRKVTKCPVQQKLTTPSNPKTAEYSCVSRCSNWNDKYLKNCRSSTNNNPTYANLEICPSGTKVNDSNQVGLFCKDKIKTCSDQTKKIKKNDSFNQNNVCIDKCDFNTQYYDTNSKECKELNPCSYQLGERQITENTRISDFVCENICESDKFWNYSSSSKIGKCSDRKTCKNYQNTISSTSKTTDDTCVDKCKSNQYWNGSECKEKTQIEDCKSHEKLITITGVKGKIKDNVCRPGCAKDTKFIRNYYDNTEKKCKSRKKCQKHERTIRGDKTTDNRCEDVCIGKSYSEHYVKNLKCLEKTKCKNYQNVSNEGNKTTDRTCSNKCTDSQYFISNNCLKLNQNLNENKLLDAEKNEIVRSFKKGEGWNRNCIDNDGNQCSIDPEVQAYLNNNNIKNSRCDKKEDPNIIKNCDLITKMEYKGYIKDGKLQDCSKMTESCKDKTICKNYQDTEPGNFTLDNSCINKCTDSQYFNGTQCIDKTICKNYQNETTGNFITDNTCANKCNDSQYFNGTQCIDKTVCKNYQNTEPGNFTTNNNCTNKCKDSQYFDGTECKDKTVCKNYQNETTGNFITDNTCSNKCTDSQFFDGTECKDKTVCKNYQNTEPGNFTLDNKCTNKCTDSQYFDGTQCKDKTVCKNYQNETPGNFITDNTCANKCTDSQYFDGTECKDKTICKNYQNTESGDFVKDNKCKNKCSDVQYYDGEICKDKTVCKNYQNTEKGDFVTNNKCVDKCNETEYYFDKNIKTLSEVDTLAPVFKDSDSNCIKRTKCGEFQKTKKGDKVTDDKCSDNCDFENEYLKDNNCIKKTICNNTQNTIKGNENNDNKCEDKCNFENQFLSENICKQRTVCNDDQDTIKGDKIKDNQCIDKCNFENQFLSENICKQRTVCNDDQDTTKGDNFSDNQCKDKCNKDQKWDGNKCKKIVIEKPKDKLPVKTAVVKEKTKDKLPVKTTVKEKTENKLALLGQKEVESIPESKPLNMNIVALVGLFIFLVIFILLLR